MRMLASRDLDERQTESSEVNETFGRYRLLERLGQGGMAEVFKAKSFGVEGFEKVLVIKRILPDLARSQEFVDMFVHEAKLAVRLSHANIVQVFDLGVAARADLLGSKQPDAYYMAMEFVNGFDLATVLSRCRRQQVALPLDMCVFTAAEIAKGLDHAHRRRDDQMRPLGIVHRDVSPQNVLLSLEGEVKVTDFGIAKARGALESKVNEDTQSRQLQGKFGYMSPEQARGEPVDARSDLFSLGVVLYECVAGVNPFSAPTTFETLRRVQACEYPPVELLRSDAPVELVAILKQAMAKDPEGRFADAGRMYETLLAFLYAHGRRYSANDLAEFLIKFRAQDDAQSGSQIADRLAEADLVTHAPPMERTPVEGPLSRLGSGISKSESGVKHVPIDRAAGMGERREVTALVIELPTRENLTPVAGGSPTGELGDKAAALALRYGGRILKREPEHLTVLFGLGEPDGRDTELATRCALLTLRALEGPRGASAGLHTGRIHVSREGEPTEDERVNALVATARDLARVKEGRACISATALRQVRDLFNVETIDTATGASGQLPVPASFVKDVRGPTEAFGRFVGRKDELRAIGELLAAATKRRARVLTIRGDHGVGKTRLLLEVARRLRKGNYNVGWHVATCAPRGREFPLSGIVCMLQVLCGVVDGDSSERIMTVEPRLRALGLHDEEVAAILTALGANVPTFAGNAKNVLRLAFARMVASLCEDRPYTFAWDAAHSMDEDSFSILEEAFKRIPNVRVLFVFAARAGFSHPLEKFSAHTALDLSDLRAEDTEKLVAHLLSVEKVPDELLRFVRERAGGHPQFVEEIIKALLEARAVTVADGQVVVMKLVGQDLALPKTLRGLVASRVASLSAEDRATLQAAAVLGDVVDAAVVAQMLDQPMSSLERSLAELKSHDFLVHTGPSELRFMSPIVREVVVDALTHEAAREMHAAASHALETVLGDRAWEHAARIATHLYESGDRERAATYFAKSGERRIEARQLESAARDYARAISLCDPASRDPKELASWLSGLATAVRLVRSSPDAAEMCDRVVQRVDEAGDAALRVRTRVDAVIILSSLHRLDLSRAQLAQAEKIAGGDESLLKAVLAAGAGQAVRQGDFKRSLALLERLQKFATEAGDKQEEHQILLSRAQSFGGLGDRKAAMIELERAEAALPNDSASQVERQKVRALIEYFSQDFRAAAVAAERGIDLARSLGLSYEVAINLHNLGEFLIRLNDFPRAYGAIRQSISLCDEFGFERLGSQNRMFLAFLDGVAGDTDAEATLRQGIRYAESNDFTWDVINGRLLLAWLFQRRGAISAARTEFDSLRDIAREAGNRLVANDCETGLQALAS
jgi:serine/threonine protein kinase/predicted ATPase